MVKLNCCVCKKSLPQPPEVEAQLTHIDFARVHIVCTECLASMEEGLNPFKEDKDDDD